MQNLYTLIILSDEGFKKEITIPAGRYCINNTVNHDNGLIKLNITDTVLLPEQTEAELYEDNYFISFKTCSDELITQKISYNSPFIFQGKCLFAIKKQSEEWRKNIMLNKITMKNAAPRYLLPVMLLLFFIVATGFMFFQYNSNGNRNPNNIDIKNTLNRYITDNNYIINGSDILILSPDENVFNIIRNKIPDHRIHKINKNKLKINNNDIIFTANFWHKKEIIHIHHNDNETQLTDLAIPEIFRKDITIRYFSFNDTIRLINDRFSHILIRYSVKRTNSNIIIYAEKRRDKEIDRIIKDINDTIFSSPGNTLVQYRELSHRELPPGVYGSVNYLYLSDNHIKLISDNK